MGEDVSASQNELQKFIGKNPENFIGKRAAIGKGSFSFPMQLISPSMIMVALGGDQDDPMVKNWLGLNILCWSE